MKIRNHQINEDTSIKKQRLPIVLWLFLLFLFVIAVIGMLSFAAYKIDDTKQNKAAAIIEQSDVVDNPKESSDIQEKIDFAVDEALNEQKTTYQKEITRLKEQINTEGNSEEYQTQIDDLMSERDTLAKANDELTKVNQELSDTNAELIERTTVSDIQAAYEEQIKQLESENTELETLLEQVKNRLEQEDAGQ